MYSQAGQDDWVMSQISVGYFVDIGAFDGIEFSNTYALELKGWMGLCIEPLVIPKRTCAIAQVAVATYKGTAMMCDSGMGSAVSKDGTIAVPCDTLRNLFAQYNVPKVIDYISLDIEGMEAEILRTFPFDRHTFRLMTVEHNQYKDGDENKNAIYEILTQHGYSRVAENVTESHGLALEDWYGR